MPEPPSSLTPRAEARLAHTAARAGDSAALHEALPPATEDVGSARGAVEEPESETSAHAEAGVVDELRAQAAPSPDIEALCERIREIIRSKRPPDEESLVDAEPEQMAREAGGELEGSVEGDAQRVAGHYDSMETPPEGTPATEPTAIEDPTQTVESAPLDAERATPDPVPAEAVSLDADVAANQARIDEAGMSSPAAQIVAEQSGDRSNPVVQAHEAQGELAETAARDPAEVLRAQEEAITSARGDMSALQERVAGALSRSRIAAVTSTRGQQDGMVESEAEKRDRVAREAQSIFDETQRTVLEMMDAVPDTAMRMWDAGKERLASEFRQRLDRVRRWIDDRHSGVGGFFTGLGDAVFGLPDWVTEEYDAAELEFSNGICDLARDISREVNTVVAGAEALIRSADERISQLFTNLGPELEGWAAEQRAQFQERLSGLTNTVHERRDDFNRDLRRRAAETVDEVRAEIHQLREAARGLVGRIANAIQQFVDDPARFIINGLLRILGIAPVRFWRLVRRIEQVVSDIVDDPESFANNLLAAIGQGFEQFFDHIGTHLLNGLLRWLFQGLGSVGVEIPRDISLRSAITFFLQLMGISWPRIRQLIARHVGEQNVALVEQVYSLVTTLIERGPEGIFEMIQQQLNPQTILDTILDAAINYLTEALITRVTARIVMMFNPAGAILQAIEAIYRVLRWIFENAERIFTLIETVVNGLADIVAGNIGGMANAVELALAGLIPPVIDFLAGYLGLGGLPNAVADAVRGLQEMVEQRLDAAIGWLVQRGRALLARMGLGGRDEAHGGAYDGAVGEELSFRADGERHRIFVDQHSGAIMIASTPARARDKMPEYQQRATALQATDPEKAGQAQTAIDAATGLISQIDPLVAQAAALPATDPQKAALDQQIEQLEVQLRPQVIAILEALGLHPPQVLQQIQLHFTMNPGHPPAEFNRQLAGQEAGLNAMTVGQWWRNRNAYNTRRAPGRSGRDPASRQYQERERNRARRYLRDRLTSGAATTPTVVLPQNAQLERFLAPHLTANPGGVSAAQALLLTEAFMRTQAALHDPDQVAGGGAARITGLGDSNVNSSIGSQWGNGRAQQLETEVHQQMQPYPVESWGATRMNVKLN